MAMQLQPGQSPPSVADMPMNPIAGGLGIVAGPGRDFFLNRLPKTMQNFMKKMPEVVYVKPPVKTGQIGEDTVGLFQPTLASQLLPHRNVPTWDKVLGTITMNENSGPTTAIHEALHALWQRKNMVPDVLGHMRPFPQRWLPMAKKWAGDDREQMMEVLAQFHGLPKERLAPEAVVEIAARNALVGGARREPALADYLRKLVEDKQPLR